MSDCRNATALVAEQTTTTAGVLRPELLARHTRLERLPCDPSLDPWVEHHWLLAWDLPEGIAHASQTLPHPACNLSVERGHTRPEIGPDPVVVTGVVTRRFDVDVRGHGWVFATKFRPGGLAALTGRSASALRDRVVPARDLLPAGLVAEMSHWGPTTPVADCVAGADRLLLGLAPAPDPRYDLVLEIVAGMLADRSVVRVGELEQRHGLSARSLQRLFEHYVGVGPKWVLARYRMHDAVSDLDAGYTGPLADLAASLGWYDQAHFHRDFVALVGVTPGDYRNRVG